MILPAGYREGMSDEELVDAYMSSGLPRESAEMYMRRLNHPTPGMKPGP